ncbi:hypothetical protein [Ochrobactrum sp. AN78]|uniref:hypothetical protein n=1 Tax=Ochrobactrum sp. AN78 TaxID=3039853 RepID=UPI002989D886|nr:hypothetical protein [Ochrobactrum sp. AN78]MDH7792329.1 hypothetical protein [Ochrobactrum sp. AN78]
MGRPDPTIATYRQRLRDGVAGKHFNKSCVSHLDIRWSRAGHNAKIDAFANGVIAGNRTLLSSALHSYWSAQIKQICSKKSLQMEYQAAEKGLLLGYSLPSPGEMSTLMQVRLIAGIGEMNEAHISDRERKANFDLVCYQICLRTIHDLFEA